MIKKCSIEGCSNKYYAKGFCNRHYLQMWKFGFIQKRTKADPNEFVIEGDMCIISLYDNRSNKIAETVVDLEDYERCSKYKWYTLRDARGNYYVRSEIVGWLAPFILGIKTDNHIIGDHIDGNTLDNRKSNLQIITHQQNCIKRKIGSNNTSGYRGVHWSNKDKKWASQIGLNGTRLSLGLFESKEEAALVYNKKALELFGKFAVLNKVESDMLVQGLSY